MAMQNKSFTANTVVTAPCGAEAFDLVSTAAFSVQYMDFVDQVPIGDAAPAVQYGAANFRFTVYAARGYAYVPGQKVAITSGASVAVVAAPVRFGN